MNKLLELNVVVESSNTKDLRSLYDHVNAQVRSLQSIGLSASDYGPMLIPVLMSKLPQELKLLITRQFGKNIWDIKEVQKEKERQLRTIPLLRYSNSYCFRALFKTGLVARSRPICAELGKF